MTITLLYVMRATIRAKPLWPLDTTDLGFTLLHERLINSSAGIRATHYELTPRNQVLDMTLESFNEARAVESIPYRSSSQGPGAGFDNAPTILW